MNIFSAFGHKSASAFGGLGFWHKYNTGHLNKTSTFVILLNDRSRHWYNEYRHIANAGTLAGILQTDYSCHTMNFDPTYNYGETDLTNDGNFVRWKFGELIKSLVTLSSSAERQKEIVGTGAICEEMAIDFENYFTLSYKNYLDYGLLTVYQIETLQELDAYLENRSGNKSPDFWDDFLLDTNHEWKIVRENAKSILSLLGMQDLTIECQRDEKYEVTDEGKAITVQSTKTRLIRQDAS